MHENHLFKHMRTEHGSERGGALSTMFGTFEENYIPVKETFKVAINKQNVCEIIFRFLLVEESKIASKLTTSAHGLGLINRTTILKLPYELEFCKFRIVDEIHEITSLKAHLPYILYFSIKSFELQMLQLILWQSRPSLLNRVSSHSHVT